MSKPSPDKWIGKKVTLKKGDQAPIKVLIQDVTIIEDAGDDGIRVWYWGVYGR